MLKRKYLLTVLAVTAVMLCTSVGQAHAGQSNLIKCSFMNTGVQPAAKARIHVMDNRAQDFFQIIVHKATPGTYDVALDGAIVDSLTVRPNGLGRIVRRLSTSTSNGHRKFPTANYDPRGGELSVQLAGVSILTCDVPTTPANAKVEIELDLTNLGVVPGDAEAEFEARNGRMEFEVELDHVAPGSYDLLVGGVLVGTIVVEPGDDDEEIEFDSNPSAGDDDDDDEMDLLLTFDPRGKEIVIQQNGVPVFSGLFPLIP
jgi:hypothetical protein